MRYSIILSVLLILPVQAAEIAGSFSSAKKIAEDSIYHDRKISFYCGCSYTKDKVVNQASCGYSARKLFTRSGKENQRAKRIEWEHVLPASLMGNQLKCWGDERGDFPKCVKADGKLKSGRECCQKANATFNKAHNDLVNLTPAIGEVNADRSNNRYGLVEDEPRKYGQCDFEFQNSAAEPAIRVRGDIARIQLYMLETYGENLGFEFDIDRLEMLQEWAGSDPVSDWELERNKRICAKQGSGNWLISECDE